LIAGDTLVNNIEIVFFMHARLGLTRRLALGAGSSAENEIKYKDTKKKSLGYMVIQGSQKTH
jgi:hypothetical protein